MQLMISALHFDWSDMEMCCDRAINELGLAGVELSLHTLYTRPHCTYDDISRLTEMRAKYGIAFAAHIWEDIAQLGADNAPEKLLGWLEVCVMHGVQGLVIHGGSYPDQRAGIDRVINVLGKVLPSFEKHGVVLNLENHYAYDYQHCQELFSEPWEFMQLFRALNSPALRFCFDTGHGNMTRNSAELLRELAPYLNHIHLADNHGVDDDHVPYRQGSTDWDGVFDALQKIKYDGTFCVEFPVRNDTQPFKDCVRAIRERWANR